DPGIAPEVLLAGDHQRQLVIIARAELAAALQVVADPVADLERGLVPVVDEPDAVDDGVRLGARARRVERGDGEEQGEGGDGTAHAGFHSGSSGPATRGAG